MANTLYGKDIETVQDLQNRITVLIFRNKIFTVEKIVSQTRQLLTTSKLKLSDEEIEKIIKTSLDVFEENELVIVKNGVYASRPQEKKEKIVTVL